MVPAIGVGLRRAAKARAKRSRNWGGEGLEPRIVLTNSITSYAVPTARALPKYLVVGPDGSIWFTEVNSIGRITYGGSVTEFPLPDATASASQIAAGPDGNLWFTESTRKVGKITPNGTITEYGLPAGNGVPNAIAAGPDGNMWFTEAGAEEVGKIAPDGTITEYPEGTPQGVTASAITAGPDGAMWFAETGDPAIARIAADGTITRFPIAARMSGPDAIVAGPDGNLWFADPVQGTLGKVTPSGHFSEYPVFPAIDHLDVGPDAAFYGVMAGGEVVRFDTTGTLTSEQPVLQLGDDSGLVAGLDGNLWLTASGSDALVSLPPDLLGAAGGTDLVAQDPGAAAGLPFAGVALATLTTAEQSPNPAAYAATIDWGDGSATSTGTLAPLANAPGQYNAPGLSVSGGHTYATAGSYIITITATSPGGAALSREETIAVAPEVIQLTPTTFGPTATVSTGPVNVATLTDSLPLAYAKLSATIDWGDGTPATVGSIIAQPSANSGGSALSYDVVGSHTYASLGQYPVHVTVAGASGASSSTVATASVVTSPDFTAYGLAQMAVTGTPFDPRPVADLASADPNASAADFVAVIDWGDGSTPAPGTIVTVPIAATAPGVVPAIPAHTVITVQGGHTYALAGTYRVSVSITSTAGATSIAQTQATVSDPAPPVVTPPIILPDPIVPSAPTAPATDQAESTADSASTVTDAPPVITTTPTPQASASNSAGPAATSPASSAAATSPAAAATASAAATAPPTKAKHKAKVHVPPPHHKRTPVPRATVHAKKPPAHPHGPIERTAKKPRA